MQANRLLTGAILCLIPAFGHHSVSAEFDVSRTVKISGTISKVEFLNPHVTFSLDVKNPDGTVTLWKVETRSPNVLQRLGITKALLAQGTTISVDANPSKDGTPVANGLALTLADGRELALSPRYPCNETAHPANCIQQADNTNGFWK